LNVCFPTGKKVKAAPVEQTLPTNAEARNSAVATLPEAHESFRQLVQPVQDYAIFLLNALGHVLSWNAGAERITGYEAEEIIGQDFSRFYPPEALARGWPQQELEIAVKEGRVEDENWRLRKDGSRFWASVIITPWKDRAGTLQGFLKITRDLTERKQAEEALRASEARLERSNNELEQFASVAAHDLQEPLRKIEAFGDRLKAKCKDQLNEQGKDYLERMLSSATRMRRLINDLLAFSRITTKARPFESVDLKQMAVEILADLEGRIQQTNGSVDVGELPVLEADPLQMRQLLQNLIGNALKFHKLYEPPVVKVASRVIHEAGVGRCEITVIDNGIGFDEQYLDRIFEVFQRLHGRQEYEGTGMGLAICRKIVERHNGTISAHSLPDRGSTFLVTLPLEQPKEGEQRGEST
jgi:PAS domain S-box-containing protein